MNTKINVAAILKDEPQGTKLYSPLCGDCWLIAADYRGDAFGKDFPIIVSRDKDTLEKTLSFTAQGTLLEGVGECMLFPSKDMRDWEKYPKQEFKDGDIVYMDIKSYQAAVGCWHIVSIYKECKGGGIFVHASMSLNNKRIMYGCKAPLVNEIRVLSRRLATDFEKQQLFDALAKKSKTWDAEKKQIIDLPKKYEFKPMDWCLMRRNFSRWELCQFSWKYDGLYHSVGGCLFHQCIPYNDQTAHLLGTTDDWRGGKK